MNQKVKIEDVKIVIQGICKKDNAIISRKIAYVFNISRRQANRLIQKINSNVPK